MKNLNAEAILMFVLSSALLLSCNKKDQPRKPEADEAKAKLVQQFVKLDTEGEHQKALELINSAISRYPKDPELYTFKASALMRLGRKDEAVKSLEDFTRLNPIAEAYMGLGMAYDRFGRKKEALQQYRIARSGYEDRLKKDPQNINAEAHLAFLTFLLGNKNGAMNQINETLKANPNSKDAKAIYALLNRYEDRDAFIADE